MPKKLTQLLIDRVDLVDKGDNPEATIALYKRKEESSNASSSNSDQKGDTNVTDAMKKLLEQVPDELRAKLEKQMSAEEEARRKKQAQEEEEEKKRKQAQEEEEEARKKQEEEEEEEEARKKQEEEEEEKKKKADQKPEDDDVMKKLPVELRKRVEAAEAKAKTAEALAKRLQDESREKEYIAKAAAFTSLPTTADDLGPILKRVADSSPEDYKKIEAVLKAANERIAKNDLLTTELGRAGKIDAGGNAWQKVEAAAAELQKTDSSLTKEIAIAKVLMSNPALHKQYHEEIEEVQ